jgi:hypothetical protein
MQSLRVALLAAVAVMTAASGAGAADLGDGRSRRSL